MGLTYRSTKREALQDLFAIDKTEDQFVIALTGNPNTGKSTVFNALTGLHQHTGNWPGKTVTNARGEFKTKEHDYVLVDLPGTYSLFATSEVSGKRFHLFWTTRCSCRCHGCHCP